MNEGDGYCLASQQLRNKISDGDIVPGSSDFSRRENGWFADDNLESRIQPASYEPAIGNDIFILDCDIFGIPRPKRNETVRRSVLQLPRRLRSHTKIAGGFELKKGYSYLIPLQDEIRLRNNEHVLSSPKSTRGRLFLNTRLMGDYNPSFNELDGCYKNDEFIELWLLLQPTQFNVIIYEDLTFNQLRFNIGDARLTDLELKEGIQKQPLLWDINNDGEEVPTEHIIRHGLLIHYDLVGKLTEGIIGLKARDNPTPIDLKSSIKYNAEDYYAPIIPNNRKINSEEINPALLSSKEKLKIPAHLCAELEKHSDIGTTGSHHDAGFVDNGFEGFVTSEDRFSEISAIEITEGTPMTRLICFRTEETPDKLYSEKIGSSYQHQVGAKPPKHFKLFDYTYAARNYKKLDRFVLTQDAKLLNKYRGRKSGFEFLSDNIDALIEETYNGFFHSRYDCDPLPDGDGDELVLQTIPYVIIFGPNHTIFSYVRAKNIKDFGETHLFGKHSIGVGGHIIKTDGPDYFKNCIKREIGEEVVIKEDYSEPKLVGTLMAYDNPVDRVHFGFVYSLHTHGDVYPRESSFLSGEMLNIRFLRGDFLADKKYETWSRILIPSLEEIYAL